LGRAKPLADHERATGRRARHLRATTLSSVPDTLFAACGSPALPARGRASAELAWAGRRATQACRRRFVVPRTATPTRTPDRFSGVRLERDLVRQPYGKDEVSSSNFGRFDRNLNTGRRPGLDAQRVSAGQTVYHDAQRPSHLTLPVIPAHD
jgi:hypothetical protein